MCAALPVTKVWREAEVLPQSGVIAVSLFGFGVALAMERGQGWLQVKRASPMPVSAYFLAKLFAAVVFSMGERAPARGPRCAMP